MKYQVIGKNIEITEAISSAIEKKISKVKKYFNNDEEVLCRAVCRVYKVGAKIEITIFTKEMTFRAEVFNNDLYAAIDLAVDKLQKEIRKLKTKLQKKYKNEGLGKSIAYENIEDLEKIQDLSTVVRTKSLLLKPMEMDEAIIRMEALGHNFFLYLDSEDEVVSCLYKRDNGGYGLIQVENKVEL
ncbi:MAG: ribosome hibernation-promoting factor, HPF/YfiA family [Bacillales bacterium]